VPKIDVVLFARRADGNYVWTCFGRRRSNLFVLFVTGKLYFLLMCEKENKKGVCRAIGSFYFRIRIKIRVNIKEEV